MINYTVTDSRKCGSIASNDQGEHCYIHGNERNEYVQLLKPRQRLAKRGIDPLLCNVQAQQRFPKQRRCCCDNHG
jgi:hypothetical protein